MKRSSLLTAVALLALLVAPLAAHPARGSFTVGSVTVRAGERANGWLEVPKVDGQSDDGTRIPISVFHGARSGPVLAITAGVHGAEYAPIVAMQRVAARLDPAALAGTVLVVHVANMPSFLKRTVYYGPVDWKNLNRTFPGNASGTLTERIAHVLVRDVMTPADLFVDVHCGDGNEALRPYVVYYGDGPDASLVERSRGMATAFGIDCIKVARGRSREMAKATYSTNVTHLMGKPTIAVESGGLARTDEESVGAIERGVFNLLRHLKMVEGEPAPAPVQFVVERDETVRSPVTGIFYATVAVDARVRKGDLLGYVTDFHGARTYEAQAPFDGVVMFILGTPPVSEGEPLVSVARFAGGR